ncbi:MAG TPA: sigma-54 dependent transcriptional regulator, partial [Verrucomicrobiae bacterium]|nr:sigma-54 dependent transcriptional regulator [Verrucomicrobiae bacterium]
VILLDVKLPDAHGLDLIPEIKKHWPGTEVIVLSGQGTITMAVEAGRRGAFNFLSKPFENEKLLADVRCAIERKEQTEENSTLRRALETMSGSVSPIFRSQSMQQVVRTVERIAPSDVTVLITGESGVGKEVIADLIHSLSPRAKNRIIKINCAALPRELIESELFGSVKGAFTGAFADREGLFRQAEGGTLFLDEISEMPVDTQSKLLRVLQDQEVRPVGGKTSYKTNCRIIAATNRRPEEAIKDGKMREDLFYRISAISVHLPPLRERPDDIMPLANSFLQRFAAQANRGIRGFKADAIDRLTDFSWPGNIRQLQNEIQRAVLLSEGDEVAAADLSISSIKAGDEDFTLLEGVERNTILQTLKDANGNKLDAAKRLGIGRQTLYNKLKAYGIEA